MRIKDSDFVNGVTQKSHHCSMKLHFLLVSLLFLLGKRPSDVCLQPDDCGYEA